MLKEKRRGRMIWSLFHSIVSVFSFSLFHLIVSLFFFFLNKRSIFLVILLKREKYLIPIIHVARKKKRKKQDYKCGEQAHNRQWGGKMN
jgi:hypothetical protein